MNKKEFERLLKERDERIEELEKEKHQLETEKDKLEDENCELKKKLLMYENAHTPPSLQKKKKEQNKKTSSGKLGAPKGHEKYEREEPIPTKTKEHRIDTCPHCNSKLTSKDVLEVIEEEIPDLKEVEVTKHIIEGSICPKCKKRVIAKNDAPSDRFGPNLKSKTTLLKHEDRLPLRKVALSLERDYGFKITHTGAMKIIRQTARRLKVPYYEVMKRIRGAEIVYIDETQYKLDGETWWLWVFVTNNDVLFVIRKSRSKEVLEEVLGKKFNGIIISDGWSAYSNFAEISQRCWAHLLRESKDLLEKNKDFKRYDVQLKELFQEIKDIRIKPPDNERRIELKKKMKEKLSGIAKRMEKHPYAKTLATKIQNGIDNWFTCVVNLEVEPTNNFAEQALRELIVQRKIMGGLRSEKGAETLEIVSTMLATWKKQGKDLFSTLRDCVK